MDTTTPSSSVSPPPRTKVKTENDEEDYTESAAMNELLGWYGYERLEMRRWAASRAKDTSSPEQEKEHKDKDECSWCNKRINNDGSAIQQSGATFCSEVCFSQSRRANFKRAKTCDWCRHVRHTVAYVDFQDGATQLQFCSDKCLNQYKMHIFCRETQAHLDLNPHLAGSASTSSLITPDLWLKNCKSRSTSPHSDTCISPKELPKSENKTKNKKSPIITVAPTSKLLKPKRISEERVQKSPEIKRDTRKNTLRKRRPSKSSTVTSQTLRHSSNTPQDLSVNSSSGPSPLNVSPNHAPSNPYPSHAFAMPQMPFMDSLDDPRLPLFTRPNLMHRPMFPMSQERPRVPFLPSIGQAPPVTVFVPYPVPLPVPIPIPIPLPMSAFLQAHYTTRVKTEDKMEETEGPLDFTMNNDKKKQDSHDTNIDNSQDETKTTENPEQTLPKFKITRLANKAAKINKKEQSESTRPLRKRRRLVEVANEDDAIIGKSLKTVEV